MNKPLFSWHFFFQLEHNCFRFYNIPIGTWIEEEALNHWAPGEIFKIQTIATCISPQQELDINQTYFFYILCMEK